MTDIVKLEGPAQIFEEAARRWVEITQEAVEARGAFHMMLSGGNTPQPLYRLMASEPWRDRVPWAQTYFFWTDERRVSPSHPDSNYRMVCETLLDNVPVPADHIFPLMGEGLASSAVRDFETKLARHFQLGQKEWPHFDLVLLGLGGDGHIASIFPGTRAVSDLSNKAIVYDVPRLNMSRITVTLPVINHARHILFLVSGEEKADALWGSLEGPAKPSTYPAQAVSPVDGTLTWLVDVAAASRLKG
jgi:6-phosphogluconolactonase